MAADPHAYRRVCDQAAVEMRNEGDLGGEQVVVDSIEIWTVRADGRVSAVRAYFEADPAINSMYFLRPTSA